MIQVREYIDSAGRNHFGVWRAKLDSTTRARIDVALDRLERGNTSAMKSVGAGVAEQRQQADIALAKILWKQYKQGERS